MIRPSSAREHPAPPGLMGPDRAARTVTAELAMASAGQAAVVAQVAQVVRPAAIRTAIPHYPSSCISYTRLPPFCAFLPPPSLSRLAEEP